MKHWMQFSLGDGGAILVEVDEPEGWNKSG